MTDYWIVDAFTDRPFAGNPAAVVPLDQRPDEAWMQAVAAEFQLSETAFCWPDGPHWRLRWFTPRCEVALCGHATLACALALWHAGRAAETPMVFQTQSGPLTAQALDPERRRIQLDFPAAACTAAREPHDDLGDILGARVCWLGANQWDWLVEVDDADTVASLRPDARRLADLPARGVIVTARGGMRHACDVVSRFFAPRVGIEEDPATGSAHCALAPFWVPRLGRQHLVCRQLSQRGGLIETDLSGERVLLTGSGVLMAHGRLLTPPG
jgi:PhzF family phenazine biosynthesis protein